MRSPPILTISSQTLVALYNTFRPLNDTFSDRELRDPSIAIRYRQAWTQSLGDIAGPVMTAITDALLQYPNCLVIRHFDPQLGCALLAGISTALGQLELPPNLPGYQVIRLLKPGHVRDKDAGKVLDELLHSDGTDRQRPNDLTCLFCLRHEEGSVGESVILTEADAIDALRNADDDLLGWLRRTPLPWRLSSDRTPSVAFMPAFSAEGLRWMRYTVLQALGDRIDNELAERIDSVQASFEGALERQHRFKLESGDLLILNNRRTLHARTAIPNPEMSDRRILRAKIACATGLAR